MKSTQLSSLRLIVSLLVLASLGISSIACTSPSANEEHSLALNLNVGNVFRMGVEIQNRSTMSAHDREFTEFDLVEWEFSFRVDSVTDEEIELDVIIDSLTVLPDAGSDLLYEQDFENLAGQGFSVTLSSDGTMLELSGIENISNHFLQNINIFERYIEVMEEKSPGYSDLFENWEEDEELVTILDGQRETFQKLFQVSFDTIVSEEKLSEIVEFIFVGNSSVPIASGLQWSQSRVSNRIMSIPQQTEFELRLSEISDTQAKFQLSSSGKLTGPQDAFEENLLALGAGFTLELQDVSSTGVGYVELDLVSGWPDEGLIEIESQGNAVFGIPEAWVEMSKAMAKFNDRDVPEELSTSNPGTISEVRKIEFRRID